MKIQTKPTERMTDQLDQSVCRHCAGVKQGHLFVCAECWSLLPKPIRAEFGELKRRAFEWLRDHAPQRRATSTTQQQPPAKATKR